MINRLFNKINKVSSLQNWVRAGLTIGDECEVHPNVSFGSEPYLINIGHHVRINSGVTFVTHDGGVWVLREYLKKSDFNSEKIDVFGKIKVGNNVHIGNNSIIMPNVTIGDNCIIGCGSIVTKSIPHDSIAAGVPAKVIETLDEYVKKNETRFLYSKAMNPDEKRNYLEKVLK